MKVLCDSPPSTSFKGSRLKRFWEEGTLEDENMRLTSGHLIQVLKSIKEKSTHTLLKQANTLGTPSLGPSMPGMKSILGPIQLNGLTIVNSKPFSAPSAVNITHDKVYGKRFNYETAR